MLSKILSVFLVIGIILPSLTPYLVIAQTVGVQPAQMIPLESVVEVPEITIDTNVLPDISRIDWEQEVNINGKDMPLNSDEALSALDISPDVKDIVRDYREDREDVEGTILMWPWTKDEKKENLDEGLQFSLQKELVEDGGLPEDYFTLEAEGFVEPGNNVFNAANAPTINPATLTPITLEAEILEVKPVDLEAKKVSFFGKVGNLTKGIFTNLISWLKPGDAYADVASTTEAALNYLIEEQNEDGSWGADESTKFINTVAALEALLAHNITGESLDDGLEWLGSFITDNNDYLAEQLEISAKAGGDISTMDALARGLDEETGGFVFSNGYSTDPLTTAKALQALRAADYEDPGEHPTHTVSLAILYLINTQRFDDGWSVFPGGVSSIPVTSEVIEALLPWKHQTLGPIEVDDTLDPAVSSLTATQDSNGTWSGDLLNTALAYHAIKASGQIPTYQLETAEYFENEQEGNGSFGDDVYKTSKVLKALSIATNSGELLITDIIPTSTLQTGLSTTFNIRMTNPGNVAVDTGKLHIVTDDYHFASFDFEGNSIVVNANSTVDISVGITNTRNYQGNVSFKVFVEGTNEVIHSGSRYQETLAFSADPNNRPGLPMYYVAYKNVSSGGAPAITWRWPIKADPNLSNVVLMWRLQGNTTWSTANITNVTGVSSATVSGFTNDAVYEATLGTSGPSGSIFFFSGSAISTIKVSNAAGTYVSGSAAGTVKALEGAVPEVSVLGVNTSVTATADETGEFIQQNIPWGTGYARVSDFRYEAYTKKYTTANAAITGVDVFTNLKPDTADPTVSGVLIVGESDKIIENGQAKLIQYTVADDIGTGGGTVKSATFHYYDPEDSNWHLIGAEEGFLSGTRTYEWNIPANLVGPGYKIKVVVRDFAGKDSAPAEWGGTFELLESCLPPVSGDWTIEDSCTLTGTVKPPASVIVNAGQVLTLAPGSKLLIDLKNFKLSVKQTGGVLIKNTATLRQIKPSD